MTKKNLPERHQFKTTKSNKPSNAFKQIKPQQEKIKKTISKPKPQPIKPNYPIDNQTKAKPIATEITSEDLTTPDDVMPKRKSHKGKIIWSIFAIIIILVALIAAYFYFYPKDANKIVNTFNNQVARVQGKSKKAKPKSKKVKVTKTTRKATSPAKKKAKKDERKWKNPGSYNNMIYKTDDFEVKLNNNSDGVKMVSDVNKNPALYIEYNFTNSSKKTETPQDIINNDVQLKQDNQDLAKDALSSDKGILAKTGTAKQQVKPGQSVDAAMLVSVKNNKDSVSMYFMNLKTHKQIDTNQPFKL